MEDDIRKITTEEKETLNPRMLKCINCGAPAELYVNNTRVCSDTVCVNKYRLKDLDNNLPRRIRDAELSLERAQQAYRELPRRPALPPTTSYFYANAKWKRDNWDEREKRLARHITNAQRSLNELIEEQTKRYQEYLQEE
jgi:hypothetical protein